MFSKVFRKNLFCVCAALVLAVPSFAAVKTGENRDENGKIVRGPYLYNGFGSNWFISAAGGINIFMNSVNDFSGRGSRAGAAEFNVGKWVSPDFGLRLGYQGWQGHMQGKDNGSGRETFGFWYVHGDVMWHMSNTIGGYKESRFWNVVPYAHCGAMRLYNHEIEDYPGRVNKYDNEIAFGCGLYNTLRFTKRFFGTLDVRETMLPSRFHTIDLGGVTSNLSVTAGLGVYLGKMGWERGVSEEDSKAALAEAAAALAAAQAAAQAEKDALNEQNRALADEKAKLADELDKLAQDYEKLKNAPAVVVENTDTVYVKFALGIAPITLFFEKNSATLSATELKHLAYYVETVMEKDPDRVFYLTGTADSSTGSAAINTKLSKLRVENTIKVLHDKYKISRDRLKFKDIIIGDENSDPRLNRTVKIEH